MNDSLISELLLDNEDVLKEVNYPLFDIEVIKLRYHCLLILQVLFILVNEGVPFINDSSYIVKDSGISAPFE